MTLMDVDPAARCVAHGKTVADHIGGYAHDCAEPPTGPHTLSDGDCSACGTYAETGMHWDTCPQRGRHRGLTADQQPAPINTTLDAELAAITAITTALLTLDPSSRARVVRWAAQRWIHDVEPQTPTAIAHRDHDPSMICEVCRLWERTQ